MIKLQWEACEDGNILYGEDENLRIEATIRNVPEDASEDYGYLTLKEEILARVTEEERHELVFWYDGQEDKLEADARIDSKDIIVEVDRA